MNINVQYGTRYLLNCTQLYLKESKQSARENCFKGQPDTWAPYVIDTHY